MQVTYFVYYEPTKTDLRFGRENPRVRIRAHSKEEAVEKFSKKYPTLKPINAFK